MMPCLLAACDSATVSNERGESTLIEADELGPWEGFRPAYFGVSTASFGYDAQRQVAVPIVYVDDEGDEAVLPISISVLILDQEAASSGELTESNHCEVVMTSMDTLPMASWTDAAGAWFAFELSASLGSTSCQTLSFDPSVWGGGVHSHVTKWVWGAGLNALTDDAIQGLGQTYEAMVPWVEGGGYYWEALPDFTDADDVEGGLPFDEDGYLDSGITFAYAVEEDSLTLVLEEGEKVLRPATTMWEADGRVATAYYEVQVNRFLSPAQLLVDTP